MTAEGQRTIVRERVQEGQSGTASLTEYSDGEVIFVLSDMQGDMAHTHILTEEQKAAADWTLGTEVKRS
jgi:hypothetical protein